MSKPLTIDELKALPRGDWVWIEKEGVHCYDRIRTNNKYQLELDCRQYSYADYGYTWLAYKNKEQAETKGEWVELPCKIGDTVYTIWQDKIYKRKVSGLELMPDKMWKVYFVQDLFGNEPVHLKDRDSHWDFCVHKTYSEAEARLEELRGEK